MLKRSLMLLVILFCSLPVPCRAGTPERIISLAPNMTEILFALGLGDRLVGVTSFCDYPPEARTKPKVGGMSNPSLEAVVSLKPDVVVMTTDGNSKEFEERLRSLHIRTYVSTARRIKDLAGGIRELGAALGVKDRADRLAADNEARLERLEALKSSGPRKKLLFIVWPDPLIVAGPGTVIDDAIKIAGAKNAASKSISEYPKYSLEAILRDPPDMIVIGPDMRDDDPADIRKLSEGLLARLKTVPAVKNGEVFYVSDDLYRLGPRTVRGIEELRAVVGQ
ncbi:MAG: cobalamin-binding protein [Candidatus Sulfobium sp.]